MSLIQGAAGVQGSPPGQQLLGLVDGLPWPVYLVLGVLAALMTAWGRWLRYRISRQAMKRVDGKDVLALLEVIHGAGLNSRRRRPY
ncbi:hypothetical protein OG936_39740 (plasmid) [Streptomyces sp. NBC_00846]|uniref:hypothetical protein n=1 Tax=Streptomyces sp. NBC_00846 TaxID=2975849 RepID=UPI002F90F36F|nr:hypothetical protein OG936_39740 [Streptomyces sp. NBC_00846]